jgi:hypothetical protein
MDPIPYPQRKTESHSRQCNKIGDVGNGEILFAQKDGNIKGEKSNQE